MWTWKEKGVYSLGDKILLKLCRFQLQEELLNRDKANDNMQRKISNLQAEMRIMAKENAALTDKLHKVHNQVGEKHSPFVPHNLILFTISLN